MDAYGIIDVSAAAADKAAELHRLLTGYGRVGLAFSGGVDSSFLLKTCLDVLGSENVVILHSRSCLQSKIEKEQADSWLLRHGYGGQQPACTQKNIELHPLRWKEFSVNPENRCYLCKHRLYSCFFKELQELGIPLLLDGTNLDDLEEGDGRPGLWAISELGVKTPLADCGLRKNEIRELSRRLQLDTYAQPSSSCLATRIPHGLEITRQRLARIEAWERAMAGLGFDGCRVRLDRESVRTVYLQVRGRDLELLGQASLRRAVVEQLEKKGAVKVYLDLSGR